MSKIEEIINNYDILEFGGINQQYIKNQIVQAMKEFGKICFEAGRENKTKYNPTKDGKLYQISIIPEFKTYEDFLKETEDET